MAEGRVGAELSEMAEVGERSSAEANLWGASG